MKLQTKNDAECVMAHGTPSVNNRRHYLRYGGVFYPLASVVWVLETGEWPKSTPRHLDGDPSNNDFGNLRKPGRAAKPRKAGRVKDMQDHARQYGEILSNAEKLVAPKSLFV